MFSDKTQPLFNPQGGWQANNGFVFLLQTCFAGGLASQNNPSGRRIIDGEGHGSGFHLPNQTRSRSKVKGNNMLRELNTNEMDIVSGGTGDDDLDEVIARATRIPDAPGNFEPNVAASLLGFSTGQGTSEPDEFIGPPEDTRDLIPVPETDGSTLPPPNTAPVTPNRLSVPGGIPIGDNFNVRPLRDGFRVGGRFEFE